MSDKLLRPLYKLLLSINCPSPNKMHALQPKHIKLNQEEVDKLLKELNISTLQLPKIKIIDAALSQDFKVGEIVKIERKDEETNKIFSYYRVVSI
ncbi:MAG: DNA-directed RNA polymerase subunit RpoH/Rpb5 C-terminal domain-containing protein [Nanoarchaeota archaeon]